MKGLKTLWSKKIIRIAIYSVAIFLICLIASSIALLHVLEHSGFNTVAQAQPVCSPDSSKLLSLINQERTKLGVPILTVDTALVTSAQNKFNDEVSGQYYGHNRLNGDSWYTFAQAQGVSAAASEDLNEGVLTAENDWTSLKGSPAHYASLTSSQYTRVGIFEQCTGFKLLHSTGPADNTNLIGYQIPELTVVHLAAPEAGILCKDGWISPSMGQGTCSSHGGER